MGPARPRAKSTGRNGPRTLPWEERGHSTGRNGPRIRPWDDGIGGHPAESPPGAFASVDDRELGRVSETFNTEVNQREADAPEGPRGRSASRPGRDRSIVEQRVAASDMEIFAARPILVAVYVCPTDRYKEARHACSPDQVQTGRPRNSDIPVPCPTSKWILYIWAGPTALHPIQLIRKSDCELRQGTSTAPSRQPRLAQWLPGSLHNHSMRATAWDKIPRLGEAKNPGPEPPRELYLDRKNGQRDPIRLCTQNGGWVCGEKSHPPRSIKELAGQT